MEASNQSHWFVAPIRYLVAPNRKEMEGKVWKVAPNRFSVNRASNLLLASF